MEKALIEKVSEYGRSLLETLADPKSTSKNQIKHMWNGQTKKTYSFCFLFDVFFSYFYLATREWKEKTGKQT